MTAEFSSAQVIARFALRMVILCVCASFASLGFVRSLAALLAMSAAISVFTGLLRREPMLGASLSYWDEAAAYSALFYLVSFAAGQPS